MSPGDFTTMPTGQRQRRALVDGLLLYTDDRQERHYLELKSAIDLSSKDGQAKVAKFVLGAANRDPVDAAGYFDGRALMVLGIAPPDVEGVEPFEDHELHAAVTKIVGDPGPRWDWERVTHPDGDVIIIVAEPPEPGRVWPAMADSPQTTDGTLYYRPSGKTDAAKGLQATAMLARVANHQPALEVAVAITGNAWAVKYDETQILQVIDDRVEALRLPQQVRPGYDPFNRERRTAAQYEEEIDEWVAGAKQAVGTAVDQVASILAPVTIKVVNRSTRYVERVRVAIDIDLPAFGLAHTADSEDISGDVFPKPPDRWGFDPSNVLIGRRPYLAPQPTPGGAASEHGWVKIVEGDDDRDRLRVQFDELHPSDEVESDNDVVLVIDDPDETSTLQGRWKMTVKGVNAVFRGTLIASIPGEPVDITDDVLTLLENL